MEIRNYIVSFFLVQENGVLKLRDRECYVRQIAEANFLCFVSKLFSGLINSIWLLMPEIVHFAILPRQVFSSAFSFLCFP